jgi:hypothetical protein
MTQARPKGKGAPPWTVPLERKTAARRPGAKEGGREEEEKRSGIAARQTGRLRSKEKLTFAWSHNMLRRFPDEVATACFVDMTASRYELIVRSLYYIVQSCLE